MFNFLRTITNGKVVGKNHYSASGIERQFDTNFNKGAAMVTVFTEAVVANEGWSLLVHGTDKSGKHTMTHEIYVEQMTWSNTEIGDKYPT